MAYNEDFALGRHPFIDNYSPGIWYALASERVGIDLSRGDDFGSVPHVFWFGRPIQEPIDCCRDTPAQYGKLPVEGRYEYKCEQHTEGREKFQTRLILAHL